MKILIDKMTNGVKGYNMPLTPLVIGIEVIDGFNMYKSISIEDGLVQRANSDGHKLYKDNVIIDEETGLESCDEVIEEIKVISYEEKEFIYKVIKEIEGAHEPNEDVDVFEDGVTELVQYEALKTMVQVPKETIKLDPAMETHYKSKHINFKTDPQEFDAIEVLTEVYQELLDDSELDYLLADVFLSEDEIYFKSSSHSANTGPGFVQLLPGGQCKLKQTVLDVPSKYFEVIQLDSDLDVEIQLAGRAFVDNVLELDEAISSCTIKFINQSDKSKVIRSYTIGYREDAC